MIRLPRRQPRPAALAVLVASVVLAIAAATPASARERTASELLAEQYAVRAVLVTEADPLTIDAMAAAIALMEEACRLAPDDPEHWRHLLALADLGEREDVSTRALKRLGGLDPADEVVALERLRREVARHQTAEMRITAARRLLDRDGGADAMGKAVASRLSMDLASLHREVGDDAQFARRLGEAVALDPGNREAAELAATVFIPRIHDPVGKAELLTNAILADPANLYAQAALSRLLLDHGAYAAAERVLRVVTGKRRIGGLPAGHDYFADLAIAQWANGRPELALRTIEEQQRAADELLRQSVRESTPSLDPIEVAKRTAAVNPTLATVRAVILARLDDPRASRDLQRAAESHWQSLQPFLAEPLDTSLADLLEQRDADDPASMAELLDIETVADPETLAERLLHLSAVLAWLGGEESLVRELLATVDTLHPLEPSAHARFEGWMALRRGEADRGIELLEPLPDDDLGARLGLGLARLAQGERRAAAGDLLATARGNPGSLLGVWAADALYELLGQRVPINDEARALDELIDSIPPPLDRASEDPTLWVGLRVTPAKTTFEPYEPITLNIEITNNSLYPLSIGRDGPIRRQVLVEPTGRIPHVPSLDKLRPFVVDIGRRLTLEAKQRLVVPVDLRRESVVKVLNAFPMRGVALQARATSNFVTLPNTAILPGPLGTEVESRPFHVEGIRLEDGAWIHEAMAEIVDPIEAAPLVKMALLSHVASDTRPRPLEQQRVLDDAAAALAERYVELDSTAQAWLLAVAPQSAPLEPIFAMARKSRERPVQMAYLVFCIDGPDDEMLDAARRSGDPRLEAMAAFSDEFLRAGGGTTGATPTQSGSVTSNP